MAAISLLAVPVLKMDYAMQHNYFAKNYHGILKGLAFYLQRDGVITHQEAVQLQKMALNARQSFTEYLIASHFMSSESLLSYCVNVFKLPVFQFDKPLLKLEEIPSLTKDMLMQYRIMPLYRNQKYLYLGVSDPTDTNVITAMQFHTQLRVRLMLITEEMLADYLTSYAAPQILTEQVATAIAKLEPEVPNENTVASEEEDDEPVIIFVDQLLKDAIKNKISDMHLEPYTEITRIRFRRDGLLYEAAIIPKQLALRVVTRLKVMANLNIAEKRLPQDGHFSLRQPVTLNIRVSTCPTLFGEKMVLRLLYQDSPLPISELGMNALQLSNFLKALQQPQGLILVTGPTGSGKTITLYAALAHLNQIERNICTAEDPVEVELEGINQVNVNQRIGLNFATTLRHFLRQDPDVIMIGEIRDSETANIAIHAAQTGHLVLATLHANSAIEAIQRLKSLGINNYHLSNTLTFIIAQRLLRKLCIHCKLICNEHVIASQGCEHCHEGYRGRTAVFEMLSIDAGLANLIQQDTAMDSIKKYMQSHAFTFLLDDALEKMKQHVTSNEEIERVLGDISIINKI